MFGEGQYLFIYFLLVFIINDISGMIADEMNVLFQFSIDRLFYKGDVALSHSGGCGCVWVWVGVCAGGGAYVSSADPCLRNGNSL